MNSVRRHVRVRRAEFKFLNDSTRDHLAVMELGTNAYGIVPLCSREFGPIASLTDLPTELILHILIKVHWSDYHSVCSTSKLLRHLANIPNSLSESCYGYLSPAPSAAHSSESAERPYSIHQVFSCAFYRDGRPYYAPSAPTAERLPTMGPELVPLTTSPFRNDSFSEPRCRKMVFSWGYIDPRRADDGAAAEFQRYSLVPHYGTSSVNNLVVGTGRRADPGCMRSSSSTSNQRAEGFDHQRGTMTHITVKDVFDAFERDHPYLKARRGGFARVVDFQHVVHPSAGPRGGSHCEVRWTWIADEV